MIIDVHHHYVDGNYYTDYCDFTRKLVATMERNSWNYTCLNAIGPHFRNKRFLAEMPRKFSKKHCQTKGTLHEFKIF